MANRTRLRAGSAAGPVDRCRDDAPDETGVGESGDDAPVTYPDWRREELARKYSDDEPREPRSSFYHPYG